MKQKIGTMLTLVGLSLVLLLSMISASCDNGTPVSTQPNVENPIAEMSSKVTALESRMLALEGKFQIGSVFSNLQNDVTTIKLQIAALGTPANYQPQIDSLGTKIAALESSAASPAVIAAINADIDKLEASVKSLETLVATLQSELNSQKAINESQNSQIASLSTRIVKLETPPTTTAPPTTTVPLTAKEAIEIQVLWLGSMENTQQVLSTEKTYYLSLSYKNNANQAFTNVKYSFSLLLQAVTFDAASPTTNELKVYTVPTSPLTVWTRTSSATSIYSFQNFQGLSVGAKAEGTLLLEVTIDSNSNGFVSLALVSVL